MILHPATKTTVASLQNGLPHAILLVGIKGVGLGTIARELASTDLAAWHQPHDKTGVPDTFGSITVEDIRSLYDQLKSGSSGRQVVVIDDADRMTPGAQNAFLKLLEEPTKGTHFVLTSHVPDLLLPTIRSRVQTHTILPLPVEQSSKFIASLVDDPTKQKQIDFIARGLPATITRLVSDEQYFARQAELARQARDFLSGDRYKQAVIAHQYKEDRPGAIELIDMTCKLARHSLSSHPQTSIVTRLDALLRAREAIAANGNPRLHLLATVV